jgi:colicin import membrane protein
VEWRGYSRKQVDKRVDDLRAELRELAAAREAVVSQAEQLTRLLEEARAENRELRLRVDRISRSPVELDGLANRLVRMVELAKEESADLSARARSADQQAEERRRQIEQDFDLAMATKRAEVARDVAHKETALRQLRERVAGQVRVALDRVTDAERWLDEEPETVVLDPVRRTA